MNISHDLAARPVGIIGFGSQGRALALNLRASGCDVSVGLRPDSASVALARNEGLTAILPVPDMVAACEIICFAFPDHLHGRVYRADIRDNLKPGATLLFLHGLSVHFGAVEPPEDTDVILLAPHGPGVAVRAAYERGDKSMSAFEAVFQDHTGRARDTLHALADAIGFDRSRLFSTTFQQEAVGDMFGEQAVLCGGLAALIKNGWEVLVENGLSPDNAYLEVAYQLDLIIDLIKQHGIEGMFRRISFTARYGSLETGPALIDASVKDRMRDTLERIQSGEFVKRLEKLSPEDMAAADRALKNLTDPRFEAAARKFAEK